MKLVRLKAGFHNRKYTAHLGKLNDDFCLAVDGGAEVSVIFVNVGGETVDVILVEGKLVTGCHSLGNTCGILHGGNVLFTPSGELCNVSLLLPIGKVERAVLTLHIEAGHWDEVICTNLNVGGFSAFEVKL